MKKIVLALAVLMLSFGPHAYAGNHKKEEAKIVNEFAELHPKSITQSADKYYSEVTEKIFAGAIPTKYAQLAALSASVAMKCEYCIPAHKSMAIAAGASPEEVKTAIAIAADVALNSSMLYGSEYDMREFKKKFD